MRHNFSRIFLQKTGIVAFVLVAALLLPTSADVTGIVTLKGTPNSKDETFIAQAPNCGESPIRHTENWKIGPKGELADVVVWVVDPKFLPTTFTIPPPPIEIKQIDCRYDPHVIAVEVGIPFTVIDADPTLHNICAKIYNGPAQPPGDVVFNFGQTYLGQKDDQEFDTPGIYTLQCNVHNWMQAWVMALQSPCFGVTGADGTVKLQGGGQLQDGDYKVDAWHPRFAQPLEQTLHVKNGSGTVTFQFYGSKSF